MASREGDTSRDEGRTGRDRVWVEHQSVRRPFMRGIMVHSLMARGISFERAFLTADAVLERIRGRGVVPGDELAKLMKEILGPELLTDHQPPIPLPAPILVMDGSGNSSPFSKGTLSQSLEAAAINPSDAFDVARDIEQDLVRRGCDQVAARELRRLSHRALLQRFGPQTADRYLVWCKYQRPEKPVILLLGGTAGVGKTALALEVALRLGIRRVLSTDVIRHVMRITLSPELMPAIHTSSFDAHRSLPMLREGEDPVLSGFNAQAWVVSVGVRALLDRAVEENTSMILDGVALLPGLVDLEAYAESAHVIFLVVARLDEESLRAHFKSRGARQKLRGSERYMENLDAILKIQEYFLELADRHDIPIVDNQTIDGSVLLVMRHVVEAVRKASGVDASELW
jgi:2-phosphoglycerate kinase